MFSRTRLRFVFLPFLVLLTTLGANACSMYKVTAHGKTLVGCNEDAWRLTSRIWFERATGAGNYGAAFTGSRFDGENGFAPQSGMNEFGLSFSRLAAHEPEHRLGLPSHKKSITNPTFYLKDILHTCKTIEEVQAYISKYDHSFFNEDVFIYIDKSGRYLIVEPYAVHMGDKHAYVLSNFCPTVTKEKDALKLDRYRNGVTFLKGKLDTTIAFCRALSDTMHVCRKRNGDGTLLTSIWDLNEGMVYLYFYHNYKHQVQFNIKNELAKGNHMLEIPALFPSNIEFEQLRNYKTPKNSPFMFLFLASAGLLILFSSLFFFINGIRTRKSTAYVYLKLLLFPLNIIVFVYLIMLLRNINIFYFSAPYKGYSLAVLNMAAYIPLLILLLVVPLCWLNIKVIKEKTWSVFSRVLFTGNNLLYLVLITLFSYWGLLNVFN